MVAEAIPIPENETTVVIPLRLFAVAVQEVEIEEFHGQTFSALLGDDFLFGEESIDVRDLIFMENPNATASISIPPNIFASLPVNMSSDVRIIHSVFLTDSLFTRRGESPQDVGGIIIAAAIVNITVNDLNPPLILTFVKSPVSKVFMKYSPACRSLYIIVQATLILIHADIYFPYILTYIHTCMHSYRRWRMALILHVTSGTLQQMVNCN